MDYTQHLLQAMKLTGFADEAGKDLATQIQATQELGWNYISARCIDGINIHDLNDDAFSLVVEMLKDAKIEIAEFGSLIGSWSKSIDTDFLVTVEEIDRCIPRMQALGCKTVRVMSYAQKPWGQDQLEKERFRRLREIHHRFQDEGITVAHENCMNWGGFSASHTLRLLEEVPGLKLIFDTGNPVFQRDRSKENEDGSFPWQDSWEFYQKVKEHIIHIHIKDCLNPVSDDVEPEYTYPGKGLGHVTRILEDLSRSNYQGFLAIEPHIATVFHADTSHIDWQQCYDSYVEYGQKLESLISSLK